MQKDLVGGGGTFNLSKVHTHVMCCYKVLLSLKFFFKLFIKLNFFLKVVFEL